MSEFEALAKSTICIEQPDQSRSKWYKAVLNGDSCTIFDTSFEADAGDTLIRQLPNDREELFEIIRVDYSEGLEMIPPSFKLKLDKLNQIRRKPSSTVVNISGSSNIQVGDHNVQDIKNSITALHHLIDRADSDPADREEAKNLLARLLRHPVVVAVLGGISTGL